MIFSYNTFEKRRRNYASSFFFIIYRRATNRKELTNRGLLLICVETTFQDIHTQPNPVPCLIERANRLLLSVKTSKNILINCVKLLDNIIIIWYNKGVKTKRGIYMEDNKKLWQEYEANYIAEYGDNETSRKYIAWLQKSYIDSLIRLSNGKIVEIEKPKMQTNFCFGYGWVDPNGEEKDAADEMAEYAKESQEYFIKKNLKQVDEIIERAKHPGYKGYLWSSGTKNIYSVSFMDEYRRMCAFDGKGEELTEEDKTTYINALQACKARFEKRLQTYLKRYGMSKIRTWSYVID